MPNNLTDFMEKWAGTNDGLSLYDVGVATKAVHDIVQNEDRTTALVANTFWQSYLNSDAFARDAMKLGIDPAATLLHEALVVPHGVNRYSLLLTAPNVTYGEPRTYIVDVDSYCLREGWQRAMEKRVKKLESVGKEFRPFQMLSYFRLEDRVASEAMQGQPFTVVAVNTYKDELTSVPSPIASVSISGSAGPGSSTAGAVVQDHAHRAGVTAAAHAIPKNASISIAGQGASLVSRDDIYTDSCFLEVNPPPQAKPTNGPLTLAPRSNEPVFFEGMTSGSQSTRVVAYNHELPYLDPYLQQTVRTEQVTALGDSGSALLDTNDYIIGFAYSRSGPQAPAPYSSWIWANAVFNKHNLSVY
ncbi:MAG: hypothetical protein JRC60_07395 [Deltaproteobacteria bacterium]|nr:hypothetical protein [Deltaproteobacteria bacterium]